MQIYISDTQKTDLLRIAVIADLIISGHTYGGQIRLAIFGSVATLPTRLEKGYESGLF